MQFIIRINIEQDNGSSTLPYILDRLLEKLPAILDSLGIKIPKSPEPAEPEEDLDPDPIANP